MGNVYDIQGNEVVGTEKLDDLLPDRLLIWHDEFDRPIIDSTKWSNVYGNYRNYNWNSPDVMRNISSGDGMSFWTAKDHPKEYTNFSGAFISTKSLFEFRYGRIEAKMRFPTASPHHTTFWTLGACSELISMGEDALYDDSKAVLAPSCGEIDIAEYDDGYAGARTHWDTGGFDHNTGYTTGGNVSSLTSTPSQWHIYACEWTADNIIFYVDGTQKGTWATSNGKVGNWNPFQIPHYLIFDCISALDGIINWDVAKTDVKWVRVYAPVDVTQFIKETAISIPTTASISVSERYYLAPTFTPSNPSDMTIKWESYNPDIVSCHGGMLIGKSAGYTMVKATTKHGCTAFCKVNVS